MKKDGKYMIKKSKKETNSFYQNKMKIFELRN